MSFKRYMIKVLIISAFIYLVYYILTPIKFEFYILIVIIPVSMGLDLVFSFIYKFLIKNSHENS